MSAAAAAQSRFMTPGIVTVIQGQHGTTRARPTALAKLAKDITTLKLEPYLTGNRRLLLRLHPFGGGHYGRSNLTSH